jgi:SAM domain (Sterile alpha motif)
MDVADWLRSLGLERYEQAFRENEIDAELLPNLTADDLKDLGVSLVGHRRRLLDAMDIGEAAPLIAALLGWLQAHATRRRTSPRSSDVPAPWPCSSSIFWASLVGNRC